METKQREREHPGHSRGLDPGHARRRRLSVRPGREWGRGGPGVGERGWAGLAPLTCDGTGLAAMGVRAWWLLVCDWAGRRSTVRLRL